MKFMKSYEIRSQEPYEILKNVTLKYRNYLINIILSLSYFKHFCNLLQLRTSKCKIKQLFNLLRYHVYPDLLREKRDI